LRDSFEPLVSEHLHEQPQGIKGSLTRPLVKADGWLDWERPAIELERHVRAMWSWPRAWTTLTNGEAMQVHRSRVTEGTAVDVAEGTVVEHGMN
jgi:methionyl-tRNA formyltransferase